MTLSSVNFTSQKISDSENKIENKHVDTTKTTTHIGLCAGYGGIELGLKRIIPNLRSVALCEIEGFAVANLVAKMEAGLMESAPIWTDLKTFPWESFRDRVDILTGGYPCQPFSAAGKRLGTEDPRHLWPFIAGGIRILRPKLCFFENVEGHISLGLREVVGELESMGYKVSWGIFSAREVGAPHQRKRVFIMAHLKCEGLERLDKWHTSSEQTELVGADSRSSRQRSAWEGYEEWADIQSIGLEKQSECCIKSEASGSGIMHSSGIHSCIPAIPGELVDSSNGTDTTHRHAEAHRLPSKHWQEVCSGFTGGANATAWPSRPGEPQRAWEPPRVVGGSMANSNSNEPSEGRGDNAEVSEVSSEQWKDNSPIISGGEGEFRGEIMANSVIVGRRGRDHGDAGGLRGEIQVEGSCCSGAEEVLGNASGNGRQHDKQPAQGRWAATVAESSQCELGYSESRWTGGCGNKDSEREGLGSSWASPSGDMGDTEQLLLPTSREHGAMDEASGIPTDGEGREPSQADPIAGATRKREGDGGNASEFSETQPSLGRDSNGTADRVDYAELQVSCDNRTDELRLLGNGVVPATAERAFRVLWSEINTIL